MIPTLPVPLRDRLAGIVLRAVHDGEARRALRALTSEPRARGWLGAADARWAPTLRARARAACAALQARPLSPARRQLRRALGDAAALFDAGLYFEVHELLEPHWVAATGQHREALRGLIQVAVGWQHLANGNRAGAASLLRAGARRLHGARLLEVDLLAFACAAARAAAAATAPGLAPPAPPFPRPGPRSGRAGRTSGQRRPARARRAGPAA